MFRIGADMAWNGDESSFSASPEPDPWAVVLEDGMECRRVGHTVEVIDGQGIFFYCTDDRVQLLGSPDVSQSLWTILRRGSTGNEWEQVAIRTAWW